MMRYAPPRLQAPRIERRQIPGGLAGTRRTAAHVGRLIRDGARDFYVRQKAIDILFARRVAPKDYLGEIEALFRWVQQRVRYTKDPFRVEVLHSARRMLELRAGDCDDMTILLGALVKSVGHPVRLVLTGPDRRRPELFSHIYLEAQYQGNWIALDATMPYAMGWSPSAPVRLVLDIEEASTHDRHPSRSGAAATAERADGHTDGHIDGHIDGGAATVGRAGARLAARPAARNSAGGGAAARSAREAAVGTTASPSAARAQRLAQVIPAGGVATRPPRETSPADHDATARPAPGMEGAWGAPAAAPRDRQGRRSDAGDPADATPASGAAAPRGHGASDAVDATAAPHAARASHGREGTRALSGAVHDASALYRRFTRFPARCIQRVAHARLMPPVVVELGQLVALVYRSDKWVGRPRTYIHYMETPPRLVSDVAGRRLFLVGGNYRVTARGIEG